MRMNMPMKIFLNRLFCENFSWIAQINGIYWMWMGNTFGINMEMIFSREWNGWKWNISVSFNPLFYIIGGTMRFNFNNHEPETGLWRDKTKYDWITTTCLSEGNNSAESTCKSGLSVCFHSLRVILFQNEIVFPYCFPVMKKFTSQYFVASSQIECENEHYAFFFSNFRLFILFSDIFWNTFRPWNFGK